jgi:hypothetical protein
METLKFDATQRYCKTYIPLIGSEEFKNSTHLKIQVQYSAGGMNYFSGKRNPRGYRVSITPVSLGDRTESFILMGDQRKTGGYIMIEEAIRYNKKRLLDLATILSPRIPAIADAFLKNDTATLTELIRNKDTKPVTAMPVKEADMPKMKPLTKEVLDAFQAQGDTSGKQPADIKIIARFFMPDGAATWYAAEYDPATREFWGFANLGDDTCAELGSFSFDELAAVRGRLHLPVERDRYFSNHTLQEVIDFKVR